VVVNGTDPATTNSAAAAITARRGNAIACVGSVADAQFCAQLVQTCVDAFGGLGLLVNNAGLTRDRSMTRMTAEEFDKVIDVHLRGTWACSAAAARAMRTSGGRILNIISGAGLFGTFGQANYAAAKAGIIGLTRVMDLELRRSGIHVNALAPVARTDMTAAFDNGAVAHQLPFPPPESVAPIVVTWPERRQPPARTGTVLRRDPAVRMVAPRSHVHLDSARRLGGRVIQGRPRA
jgi:NAD(P)-dependent dehydrogenase (short-subunit alcohol dehydrogenase family)